MHGPDEVMAIVTEPPLESRPASGGADPPWDPEALRPRLVGLARRVLRHRGDAEDVVSECLARWFARRAGDEQIANVAAWLKRTVLHLAIDRARAWVANAKHLESYGASRGRPMRASEDPVERATRIEAREAVWRHVLELAPRQRQVVILHDMEGLPYAEVAEVLGIDEGTARAHAHAARAVLRQKLMAWGKERQ